MAPAGPHDMDEDGDGACVSGAFVGEAVAQQASQFEAGLLTLCVGVMRALVSAGLALHGRGDKRIARFERLDLQRARGGVLGHGRLR